MELPNKPDARDDLQPRVIRGIRPIRKEVTMDSSTEWAADVFVAALSAPLQSLFPAWFLQIAFRWVTKSSLRYWRSYGACVLGMWIACVLSFVGALLSHATQSQALAWTLLTIPACILAVSLFYGRFLKTADGTPIGGKKGFLILLAQLVIGLGIALVFIVIGIGLVIFSLALQGMI